MLSEADRRFLAAAIRVGKAQLGRTWPNPAVGCLIVRDGVVVGQGSTGEGGRPHGETSALREAGSLAGGATAYVSLEPCNHHGKTGPCTEALIGAGIGRVVIALGDPDPRVSGSGVARLREAGVDVAFEPFADLKRAAMTAHRGHIYRVTKGRLHVTLKLALSADLAIGKVDAGQVTITSSQTNRLMHGLRARMDAIGVGAGTLRVDAPQLTVRLPGLDHRSPRRVVFGGNVEPRDWIHLAGHDLAQGLRRLTDKGLTSVLVEGGAKISESLLQGGLVDEVILIKGAPTLGAGAIRPFAFDPFVDGLPNFMITARRTCGPDTILTLAANRKA